MEVIGCLCSELHPPAETFYPESGGDDMFPLVMNHRLGGNERIEYTHLSPVFIKEYKRLYFPDTELKLIYLICESCVDIIYQANQIPRITQGG